jgi:chromate reductase
MIVLTISGSNRKGSFNTRLAELVAAAFPEEEVTRFGTLEHLPFYNSDVESVGAPEPVVALREAVDAADLVVFVTPEYNGTVPGLLANAVDWLSRPPRRSVLVDKPALVLSASPTRFGGIRAAEHLRGVLTHIGADVLDLRFSVPLAHDRLAAGSDSGMLTELHDLMTIALRTSKPAEAAA